MRLVMAPSFQDQEPPENPVRFSLIGGLALGTLAASTSYYGYGYPYSSYGYYPASYSYPAYYGYYPSYYRAAYYGAPYSWGGGYYWASGKRVHKPAHKHGHR